MKKLIYTVIVILFVITSINKTNAQGFSFTPLDGTFIQNPYYPDSTQVVKFQAIVRNTSSTTLNFKFARISNILASGFETQMCYDLCYAPFVDTISLPGDPPYSIAPNHVDTLFYIDFTCTGQGVGTSIVKMFNTSNPDLYVQDTFKVQIGTVGINNLSSNAENFYLSQNYPNPFNPVTKINYELRGERVTQNVTLKVFDVLGNEIATLVDDKQKEGSYSVNWNASDFPSGIYLYELKTDNFTDTKKMLLIK